MIVETLAILILLWSGVVTLRFIGFRGWPLLPLGFLAGTSIFVVTNYVFIIYGLNHDSLHTLVALFAVTTLIWLFALYKNLDVSIPLKSVAITAFAVILLVFIFREANLVKFHFDSFRYLITGSLISEGNLDLISPNLITKRFSSVSIIHSPANLSNELYLKSVTPLISLSILGSVFWLIKKGLRDILPRKTLVTYGILAVLILATNNRYIWHSFYINGHLLFAGYFLLSVGIGWLLANKDNYKHSKKLTHLQALSVIGLVFTRPEAPFFAAISILPSVISNTLDKKYKSLLMLALGVSTLMQSWYVVLFATENSSKLALSYIGFILMGLLLLAASVAILFLNKLVVKMRKYIKWLFEAGILSVLLLLFIRKPDILTKSLDAVVHNVYLGVGLWGWSIIILTILTVIILVVYDSSKNLSLRLAVTTFLPISLVIAYLREGAYRVSVNDSFNRMLIQIIPILVLFIVVSISSGNVRPFWNNCIKRLKDAKVL